MRAERLLIVDSNRPAAERIARTFSSVGFTFDSVTSCAEAMRAVGDHRYDVVLVAEQLSDADGLDCFARLRRQQHDLVGLLLADHADVNAVFAAVAYGVEHVLRRPVDVGELLSVVTAERA